jgi:hypothetical protein
MLYSCVTPALLLLYFNIHTYDTYICCTPVYIYLLCFCCTPALPLAVYVTALTPALLKYIHLYSCSTRKISVCVYASFLRHSCFTLTYIYTHIYMYIHIYIHIYIYILRIYIYTYIYTYICTYIYIYICFILVCLLLNSYAYLCFTCADSPLLIYVTAVILFYFNVFIHTPAVLVLTRTFLAVCVCVCAGLLG